jgi:hypothetical protein
MARVLIKAGLWILAVSVAVVLVAEAILPETGENLSRLAKFGLLGGAAMTVLGLILAVLGRGASALFRRRCVRCGKPVARGATYCPDHLKESVEQARDKAHRHHGSGV